MYWRKLVSIQFSCWIEQSLNLHVEWWIKSNIKPPIQSENGLLVFLALKVSVFRVFLVRIFPDSDWIRTIKTPNTDFFHAAMLGRNKGCKSDNLNELEAYKSWGSDKKFPNLWFFVLSPDQKFPSSLYLRTRRF